MVLSLFCLSRVCCFCDGFVMFLWSCIAMILCSFFRTDMYWFLVVCECFVCLLASSTKTGKLNTPDTSDLGADSNIWVVRPQNSRVDSQIWGGQAPGFRESTHRFGESGPRIWESTPKSGARPQDLLACRLVPGFHCWGEYLGLRHFLVSKGFNHSQQFDKVLALVILVTSSLNFMESWVWLYAFQVEVFELQGFVFTSVCYEDMTSMVRLHHQSTKRTQWCLILRIGFQLPLFRRPGCRRIPIGVPFGLRFPLWRRRRQHCEFKQKHEVLLKTSKIPLEGYQTVLKRSASNSLILNASQTHLEGHWN